MTETGTYLYAIAKGPGEGSAEGLTEGLTGVAGEPVRTVTHEGLVGVVGTVPLAEFGEEALRRNLEDLGWLEAAARAHHRVVDAVARRATTAPVRLVTVYRGDAQVHDLLERGGAAFAETLDMVTGRQEWGVKVYADPQAAAAPARSRPATTAAGGRSGAAYLERRRTGLRTREEAWRRAAAHAEHVDRTLSALAVARRMHRPQDPQLSGRSEWMVLNAAYLVDEERGGEFAAAAGALTAPRIEVELTGPWAPYSFTAVESGGPDAEGPW